MTFIVVLVIAGGMFIGFRRGFLRSAFKLLITILSIVISYVLAPVLADAVIRYTSFDDNLQASIAAQMEQTARQQIKSELDAAVGQYGIPVTEDMIDAALDTQLSEGQQTDLIQHIALPESVRESLSENAQEHAAGMAARSFYQYIAGCLAQMVVRALTYVATFVLCSLIMFILYMILSFALKMASLGGLNRVAGALFGGAQALAYVWIVFLVIHYVTGTGMGNALYEQIQANILLRFIDQHNLLQPIVDHMIAGIL